MYTWDTAVPGGKIQKVVIQMRSQQIPVCTALVYVSNHLYTSVYTILFRLQNNSVV